MWPDTEERRPWSESGAPDASNADEFTPFDHYLSGWIDRAEVEYQLARELRYPAVADIFRRTREDLIDLVPDR